MISLLSAAGYFLFSFLIAWIFAPAFIDLLKKLKSEQSFREQGMQSHIEEKKGTPTMGAWIFLLPIFLVLIFLYLQSYETKFLIIFCATMATAVLGAVDDIYKVVLKNFKGLDSKTKLLIQALIAAGIYFFSNRFDASAPWFEIVIALIWVFLVLAGSSNSYNLTDGLDGLATSVAIVSFSSLAFFVDASYSYLIIAICAALFAFLLFNKKPAQVFMGDTGSLSLGTLIATIAYLEQAELLLLVFAIVPVLEAISVILQVLSAKISRKFFAKDWRLFKMAPLHHHFELSGFSESQIVIVFAFFQLLVSVLFFLFST